MSTDQLKEYYEETSHRFWDPRLGMTGRDLDVYPLLNGLSGTLLEYGCGCGSLLLGLAKEDRFNECFGVDISERLLLSIGQAWNDLKSTNQDKLKLMAPQYDHLPNIPDKAIDIIVSVATIEHVINPYVVLDELHRIGSDKVTLICSVPNYAYLKHRLQLLFGIQPKTGTDEPVENWRRWGWDGMHLHTFTKSSFSTLLNDCGWKPEKWKGCGKRFGWLGLGILRRRYPGLLSGELIVVCKKR
jgi:SAM-dependent methyltransferase